jgi:hypothetical protein
MLKPRPKKRAQTSVRARKMPIMVVAPREISRSRGVSRSRSSSYEVAIIYSFAGVSGAVVWGGKVRLKKFMSSSGSGKTMVVFFSTPISVRVWR